MKKPIYTECPLCGKVCMIDEPHEEIYTKRKQWIFVHIFCDERRTHETVDKKN